MPDGVTSILNSASIDDDGLNGVDPNSANNTASLSTLLSSGPTDVCGTIETDTTWTPAQSPYVLTCNVTVSTGVTLTLQPGTIVKIGQDRSLTVNGELVTEGMAESPVYFTSLQDDSVGGDTNDDADATSPAPDDWGFVEVSGATASATHTHIRYGGGYDQDWSSDACVRVRSAAIFVLDGGGIQDCAYSGLWAAGNVSVTLRNAAISGHGVSSSYEAIHGDNGSTSTDAGALTLEHVTIADNRGDGVFWYGTSLSVSNSTIQNNGGRGIFINASESVNLTGNNISGNVNYGLYNGNTAILIDARNNWWGSSSGPSPYGSGNGINYRTCTDPELSPYICQYYVDATHWLGQSESYGQDVVWNAYVADPVNTATGNYSYVYTDISIPTRSLPMAFSRSYNSAYPEDGPLGFGWTHSYNIYVTESTVDNSVTVHHGDGHEERYSWDGTSYVPPAGVFSILEDVGGVFHLALKDQTRYNFDQLGRLSDIADRNGNVTEFTYTNGLISSVTAPDGRTLEFHYTAENRLSEVQDPLSRSVQFIYTLAGELATVTDVSEFGTHYTYNANHRLLTITDANGHTFVNNTYNDEGRVVEQHDAENNLTTFNYDILNHATTVTDPLGHETIYQYDADLRLTSQTDALGYVESYTYDDDNNCTSVTDERGNVTSFSYDERGNTTAITNTLEYTQTFTYDADNNLLTRTDSNGHSTTYTYDTYGNRLTTTDPELNTTTYTYYSDVERNGLLATVTDPRSIIATYDYSSQGDLTSVTAPAAGEVNYTYDLGGRQLTFTDARGNTWSYTYDDANRLLTETNPLFGVTTHVYDPVGNLLSTTDPDGRTSAYTYTAKDERETITNPEAFITTFIYDAVGNLINMTDGNGHTTTYSHDELNRPPGRNGSLGSQHHLHIRRER